MNWTLYDYLFALVLIGGASTGLWVLFRQSGSTAYRAAGMIAVLAAVLLVWINGAVGIIGAASNDANAVFGLVLLVALAGAAMSRLRASGLSKTMMATGATQVLVGVVALVLGLGTGGASWPWDVIGFTVFFSGLWGFAALLFSRAGPKDSGQSMAELEGASSI